MEHDDWIESLNSRVELMLGAIVQLEREQRALLLMGFADACLLAGFIDQSEWEAYTIVARKYVKLGFDMNKERIQLLIDALRSGEFQKTTGYLKRDDCYCGLGVACEIFARTTGKGSFVKNLNGVWEFILGGSKQYAILPEEVQEWYGFNGTCANVVVNSSDLTIPLTTLNDNGMPFNKIADILEKNV